MKRIFVPMTSLFFLFGCVSKDPDPVTPEIPVASTKGVLVVNEGGFGSSNSSLTLYVPDSAKVYADVFAAANNRPLGDVANDIAIHNGKVYIVVQNSDKIEVISSSTFASLGTLFLPGKTPNKIVIVNDTKGYVTNLYKGTVTSFNPTTLAVITDSIPTGLNPQDLLAVGGKLFVCNSGYGADSTVTVINIANDSVLAKVAVGHGPTDIAVDADGEVIVVSTGRFDWSNPANDTPGNIAVIDPATLGVVTTIAVPLATYGHPGELAVSPKGYGYTVGKSSVIKFDTKTHTIVAGNFIPRSFYSIAVDNVTERLYGGDAKDFAQNGTVYVYDQSGAVRDSATVGIIPGTFHFLR